MEEEAEPIAPLLSERPVKEAASVVVQRSNSIRRASSIKDGGMIGVEEVDLTDGDRLGNFEFAEEVSVV